MTFKNLRKMGLFFQDIHRNRTHFDLSCSSKHVLTIANLTQIDKIRGKHVLTIANLTQIDKIRGKQN